MFVGVLSDSDSDGVIDPWDCQPFNPDEDGIFGDLVAGVRSRISAARAYVRPDYGRAARRRQAVRQSVSGGARQVTRTIRRGAAAVERRTRPARRTVRQTVSRLPIKPSASRAAERRAAIAAKLDIDFGRAADRRADVMAAGVIGAPKQILTGISEMGTQFRGRMEGRIADVTAMQQAKFNAPGAISGFSKGFYEKAARVATVARRFETQDQVAHVPAVLQRIGAPKQVIVPGIEPTMQRTEKRLGLQSEWIPAPIRTVGGVAKEFGYGVAFSGTAGAVEMVGMIPVGVETMARDRDIILPAITVGAVKMGEGMWHGATTSPLRMAGEFTTFGALMKAPSLSPVKVKPSLIRFPEAKGIGFGLEVRKGGVAKFEPAITVMPRAEKLVTFGTPKVMEAAITGKTPFTPKTALEAKIVAKSLGQEGAKVTEALAVRWETAKAGVKIKEIKPTVTEVLGGHGITKKSASAVIKTIKSHKGDLYGSIIQRAAAKEGLTRIPRDFDVVVKDPIKFAKDVAARINKAEGGQVVVAKDGKVTVRKTGEKLFDIHSREVEPGVPYGREEIGWGLLPEKMIKVEGVRMRSFSEQLSRKLEGGMIVGQKRTLESPLGSVTGRIVPKHEGRIKDILDFYTGEKLGIKRLRERGRVKSATRAEKHLERWLNTWGKDVAGTVRSISKEQIKTGVVTEFAFRLREPGVTAAAAEAVYRGYPAYAPVSARPSILPATYPSMLPSVPPSIPPSVPPSMPPSVPPSMPPSVSPYAPPSAPPSVPLSVPPSVPPSMPPSAPPSAPPSVPPSIPPSVPPSMPPSAPPSAPPSIPPSVPPSVSKILDPPPYTLRKISDKDKKKPRRRKTPGKRKPFEWFVKHEMVTLGSFLGDARKPPAHGTFPEPDLGVPTR